MWSRRYNSCIDCGTVERKHWGHGRCKNCYYKAKRRERGLKKVHKREHQWINEVECKYCPKCKEWKDLEKFVKNPNARDGLCHYCTLCKSRYDRRVCKNVEQHRQTTQKNQRKRSDERKFGLLDEQGGGCYICGVRYVSARVYDLHHLDPNTKENLPSVLLKRAHDGWKEEAEKCVVTCATCHRLVEDLGEEEARREIERIKQ